MDLETVRVERRDGIAIVSLARPDEHNALTPVMNSELTFVAHSLASDPSVGAAVLRGDGSDFSVGADLNACLPVILDGTNDERRSMLQQAYDWVFAFASFPKPLVTAVRGIVAGSGVSMTALGHFRLAASDTIFYPAFTQLGLVGDCGFMHLLPPLIGTPRTRELLSFRKSLDVDTAYAWGFVSSIVGAADLDDSAIRAARTAASVPAATWAACEELLARADPGTLQADLERELTSQLVLLASPQFAQRLNELRDRR